MEGREEGRKVVNREGKKEGKREIKKERRAVGAGAAVDAGLPSSSVSLPITSSMDVYSHMAVTRRPMELCVLSNHVI